MTEPFEPYWGSERGVDWTAIDPNLRAIASRLPVRLRRQTQWMAVAAVTGMLFGAMGVALGLMTIGTGLAFSIWNFVSPGLAIITMSVIVIVATWPLRNIRSPDGAHAMSPMIDLALDYARKTVSLTKAGLYCCGIAAIFGLVGTAIRTHFERPPKMSPMIALTVVALVALIVFILGQQSRRELGKYRRLKHALAMDGAA